jgi:hypothetical protein
MMPSQLWILCRPYSIITKQFQQHTEQQIFHMQLHNHTFHNLCSSSKIPLGTRQLLGLYFKYCLALSTLKEISTKQYLKWPITSEHFFNLKSMIAPTIPMILITLNKLCWNPLPAPLHIENKITEFEKMLREQQSILALKQNKTKLIYAT